MWIFTKYGFYSVVRAEPATDGTELVMVRARVRDDLVGLERRLAGRGIELAPILEWPGRDYPYRVILKRAAWAEALRVLGEDIDYPNFKSAVAALAGKARAGLYARVWAVMFDAERWLSAR